MTIKVVGSVNCTPDSFSDGTGEGSLERLIQQACRAVDERIVAEHFGNLPYPPGALLLGYSRKGSLKALGDLELARKDLYSAGIGAIAARKVPAGVLTYLRVHNVARQREALQGPLVTLPNWRAHAK